MHASRPRTRWTSVAVVTAAVVLGAAAVSLTPAEVEANPTQSIHRAYYNAAFTNVVGGKWILKCGGGGGSGWGQTTSNYLQTTAPCSGSQPPLELCYVDGMLDICPPGV